MWNDRYSAAGLSLAGRASFDPGTAIMGGSLALSAIGTGVSAAGTLAGGAAANQAGALQNAADVYQATQLEANEPQAIASSQRQMLDTQMKTRLAVSTARARAAGNGVNAAVGSPMSDIAAITSRGKYQSMMDLWRGESEATGLENQAKGVRFSGQAALIGGEEAQSASEIAAAATIAGGGASMLRTYADYAYPNPSGRPGVRV